MSRTVRLCMSVRGALRRADQHLRGMFSDTETGRTLTPPEAREHLMDELAKGHEVIPCANDCGNPCPNADKGCTGFDYSGGGCPGFEVPDEERAA